MATLNTESEQKKQSSSLGEIRKQISEIDFSDTDIPKIPLPLQKYTKNSIQERKKLLEAETKILKTTNESLEAYLDSIAPNTDIDLDILTKELQNLNENLSESNLEKLEMAIKKSYKQNLGNPDEEFTPDVLVRSIALRLETKHFESFLDFCDNLLTKEETLYACQILSKKCTNNLILNWLKTNSNNLKHDYYSIHLILLLSLKNGLQNEVIDLLRNNLTGVPDYQKVEILKILIEQGEIELVLEYIKNYFIENYLSKTKKTVSLRENIKAFYPICTSLVEYGYGEIFYKSIFNDKANVNFSDAGSLIKSLINNGYANQIADFLVDCSNRQVIPEGFVFLSEFINEFLFDLLQNCNEAKIETLKEIVVNKLENKDHILYYCLVTKPEIINKLIGGEAGEKLFNIAQQNINTLPTGLSDLIMANYADKKTNEIKNILIKLPLAKLLKQPITTSVMARTDSDFQTHLIDLLIADLNFRHISPEIASFFLQLTSSIHSENFKKIADHVFDIFDDPQNKSDIESLRETFLTLLTAFAQDNRFTDKCVDIYKSNQFFKRTQVKNSFLSAISLKLKRPELENILNSDSSLLCEIKVFCLKQNSNFDTQKEIQDLIQKEIQSQTSDLKSILSDQDKVEDYEKDIIAKVEQMSYSEAFFTLNFMQKTSIFSDEFKRFIEGHATFINFGKTGSELKIFRLLDKSIVFVNTIPTDSAKVWQKVTDMEIESDETQTQKFIKRTLGRFSGKVLTFNSSLEQSSFDTKFIPCAPILKTQKKEHGKTDIYSAFCGINLAQLKLETDNHIMQEINLQINEIEHKLSLGGITHGHTHAGNYVVELIDKEFLKSEEAQGRNINQLDRKVQLEDQKLSKEEQETKARFSYNIADYSRNPDKWQLVVRLIDWDRAEGG